MRETMTYFMKYHSRWGMSSWKIVLRGETLYDRRQSGEARAALAE